MDITQLSSIAVPLITCMVYFVISAIKQASGNNEKLLRFVPVIAAVLGIIFGIAVFLIVPSEMTLSHSIWAAAFVGGISGLAATGTNQIFKQLLSKPKQNEEKTAQAE